MFSQFQLNNQWLEPVVQLTNTERICLKNKQNNNYVKKHLFEANNEI